MTTDSAWRPEGTEPIIVSNNWRQLRRRVNVAISVKGIITWDCTMEGNEGYTEAELLAESDSLVAQLKQRYPVEGGEK